jgi:hypothetical protein
LGNDDRVWNTEGRKGDRMIPCWQCLHHVLLTYSNDAHATGRCSHCGAEYEVTVTKTKDSPMDEEQLASRKNRHMGD